jgi:hypothetical protein
MRLCFLILCSGCYTRSHAADDASLAWQGHMRGELEARLGPPHATAELANGMTSARWLGTAQDDVATATIDPRGIVTSFDSPSLAAGIPDDANLRTGLIAGAHLGAGVLANALTPMPSFGMYVGGMVGPRMAVVGAYEVVTGRSDNGYAMGHAWAFAIQYWPDSRAALRAGTAFVLDFEPGLVNPVVAPGIVGSVSYGLLRSGSFVLDVRYDFATSLNNTFGALGVGVNLN